MTSLKLLEIFIATLVLWLERRGEDRQVCTVVCNAVLFFFSICDSVTVSVITIKGTESELLELGRVADITGGHVGLITVSVRHLSVSTLSSFIPHL